MNNFFCYKLFLPILVIIEAGNKFIIIFKMDQVYLGVNMKMVHIAREVTHIFQNMQHISRKKLLHRT